MAATDAGPAGVPASTDVATGTAVADATAPSPPAAQATGDPTDPGRSWRLVRPSQRTTERMLYVLSPIVAIALWQLAADQGWIDTRFFPRPSSVASSLWDMILDGSLWDDIAVTLKRVVIGYAIGAAVGLVVGLAMGLFPYFRGALQPLVDATFPMPKLALLPLFILMFGIGDGSKYAIVASAVVYIVMINTASGVRTIDRIYFDVGRNVNAGHWLMFRRVALPGAMPSIIAGLQLGMGVSLLVIVAAEFVGARSGVGFMIWSSWQTFQIDRMYVGLLISALMGLISSGLLRALGRRLVPWVRDHHA